MCKTHAQFGYAYGNQGYNYGESLCYTPHDSGYFLLGSSGWYSNGNTDFVLYKLDSLGKIKWVKNYGGFQVDKAVSIVSLGDTVFSLFGYSNNNPESDYQIKQVIVNRLGDIVFEKEFGSAGWDVINKAVVGGTNFLLAGQTYSNSFNNGDAFILKTTPQTDTLALFVFGDTTQEMFNNVSSSNNCILACGYKTNRINGFKQPLLVKLDTALNILDTFLLSTVKDAEFNSARQLLNKNILAVGYIKNAANTYTHKLLCLFDSLLNLIFIDSTSFNGDEYWKDFLQLSDSNLLFTGGTKLIGNGPYGFYDILFRYTTQNIDFLGGPTYGGIFEDTPNEIISLNDSVFACIGNTKNFGPALNHIFFIKFNIKNPLITPEKFLIGFNEAPESLNVSVIPNPVNDYFKISGIKKHALIKVFDCTGQCVVNKTVQELEQVSIRELNGGLYLLLVEEEAHIHSFKIVKQ